MDLGEIMKMMNSGSGSASGGGMSSMLELIGGNKGGLNSLTEIFGGKGMGELMESWVGKGENKEAKPEQMEKVLGSDKVKQFAEKNGMDFGGALGLIAQFLPLIIDKLTPDGSIPGDGFEGLNMDMLKKFL
ncbi:MAG: hypothetical protein C0592_13140 [Marinilabiliales bacterium]|nr:MAG: hypothetical protein C0592_13140 [Marinilabiliales bacterium]